MNLKQFIAITANEENIIRPELICNDGFRVSIQASKGHYCDPREFSKEYKAFELGFPSMRSDLLTQYAENPDNQLQSVFGYVPFEIVELLIKEHGGIDIDKTFKI